MVSFRNDSGQQFSSKFRGTTGADIPYGQYWVHVQTERLGPIRQRMLVDRQDVVFVLARSDDLIVQYLPGRAPQLRGQVLPVDATQRPLWVKLCGLYLDGCQIAAIDTSGRFTFTNITKGTYVVSVLAAAKVQLVEWVNITAPDAIVDIGIEPDRNRVTVTPSR